MRSEDITAIVLCGGAGSRLGVPDKTLVATYSANLETLPGASGHPTTMAGWKTQPVRFGDLEVVADRQAAH